jgi:hypothetical protein
VIDFHVLAYGDRWQISRDGSRIAIFDSQEATLAQACCLAQSAGGPSTDRYAQIVLHDVDGHVQRRMTVPQSQILL